MNAFQSALRDGDVSGLQAAWNAAFPNLPALRSHRDAEVCLHRARTEARFVETAKRLYSHRWLEERGLPSGLPAEMRPHKPEIAEGIGICVHPLDPMRREEAKALEARIAGEVGDLHASGKATPERVRQVIAGVRDGWPK